MSQIVNIKAKRENSEFKILNFKGYKFYFHCLTNAKLKPYMKVLKNLFHNMALKKLCNSKYNQKLPHICVMTKWMANNYFLS